MKMSKDNTTDNAKQFQETSAKEKRELLQSRLVSSQFGNMVTVMMQSPHHKDVRLSELHDRLVPPLLTNQFRLAEARKKNSGTSIPVALILWARVSDAVHQRMVAQLDSPFELTKDEWQSGDNYWIIDAVGSERFLAPILSELRATEFAGKTVRFRAKSPDGPTIRTLAEATQSGQNDNASVANEHADQKSIDERATVMGSKAVQ